VSDAGLDWRAIGATEIRGKAERIELFAPERQEVGATTDRLPQSDH
jgi:hypothetical protein